MQTLCIQHYNYMDKRSKPPCNVMISRIPRPPRPLLLTHLHPWNFSITHCCQTSTSIGGRRGHRAQWRDGDPTSAPIVGRSRSTRGQSGLRPRIVNKVPLSEAASRAATSHRAFRSFDEALQKFIDQNIIFFTPLKKRHSRRKTSFYKELNCLRIIAVFEKAPWKWQ